MLTKGQRRVFLQKVMFKGKRLQTQLVNSWKTLLTRFPSVSNSSHLRIFDHSLTPFVICLLNNIISGFSQLTNLTTILELFSHFQKPNENVIYSVVGEENIQVKTEVKKFPLLHIIPPKRVYIIHKNSKVHLFARKNSLT